MSIVPYGRQWIDNDDIADVVQTLKSDWLTTGPKVAQFEQALAEHCGVKHAIAVANGTAALHVAMLAAGVGPGDCVLTSANTFVASANCAEFVGASARFADIDPETLCVNPEALDAAGADDLKAVVPVDFAGYPCVTKELADYIQARGARVIEDASHAIGASRDGYHVGGLPWVDMTTFSFHPVKTITCGEGGAILTNDDALAGSCRRFRNHGIVPVTTPRDGHPVSVGPWYYEMTDVGYNYRITDFQCALGLSQLRKLDRFIARRQEIVDRYNEAFADLPRADIPILPRPDTCCPAWHLYVLQIDFPALGKTRVEVMNNLRERGVGTQVHYIPVHLQPYYRRKYGYRPGMCPNAEQYYERCLSLPLFPGMTPDDVDLVINGVRTAVAS